MNMERHLTGYVPFLSSVQQICGMSGGWVPAFVAQCAFPLCGNQQLAIRLQRSEVQIPGLQLVGSCGLISEYSEIITFLQA